MDIDAKNVEELVRRVLQNISGNGSSSSANIPATPKDIPSKVHVAYLTALEKFEIKEVDMPAVGDDDILVKVEGCGICGTDAHEFKKDPFGLIPVVLGHEGTGEIVKMGKNVKLDSAGKS